MGTRRGGCTSVMFVGGDRAAAKCVKAARDLFGVLVADLAGAMTAAHGRTFKKGLAYACRDDAYHICVCEFTESPLPGCSDGGQCQPIDYVAMRVLVAAIDECSYSEVGVGPLQAQTYLNILGAGLQRKANIESWRSTNIWAMLMCGLSFPLSPLLGAGGPAAAGCGSGRRSRWGRRQRRRARCCPRRSSPG